MDKNLTTQQFLELIWGTDVTPSYGYILTEPVKAEGATTKPVWKTTTLSVDALSTAEQIVPKLDARPNTSGLFYMPAILSAPTRDSGNQKRLLRSNNPANNKFKRGFRTFFLDLDCGPGKPYPNQMEGLRALGPFLKAAGLPRCNVIVNSGNGLHLYWVMDEILPFDKWLPMATVLKALCKEHGFKADPTITADVARVLRLPGSHNRKDRDNPRKCTAKQIGPQIASELLRAVLDIGEPKPTLNISSALAGPVSDDLRGSVGSKPSFMKQIVKRCQYFAHIAKNGGADCDEPMWMQTIHVCTFAEDGNEWAHVLSRGHKDYSEGGTEDKLEARRRVRAQQPEVSASRCDTLEDADSTGCDLCNGCEYKGKIKSPMQLGRGEVAAKVAEVAVDDLLLPKGYTRNAEGGIWLTKPGGDGEPLSVPIAPGMAILRLEITYITDRDAEGQVTLHFATNVPRSITLMASEFHTQQLPIQLGKQGFDIVSARDLIAFKEFIMSWIIKLKAAGQVKHGSIRLGWPDYTQGEPPIYANFNLGAISYNVDGTETPSFAAVSTADDTFCARGSRAKWDDAVKLLVQAKQPELMTILAASFASSAARPTTRPVWS
ncbi:hypothetical protein DRQ32_06355 [bacterium]|nr:MAG: hypothetical protein DRQ32_06355 [bacterium]